MPLSRSIAASMGWIVLASTWLVSRVGGQTVEPLLSPQVVQTPLQTTASQLTSNQLDQLFSFETTPDKNAAREGYLTAEFSFEKFPGSRRQYRETLQGEYGITDQWAAGAFIPVGTTELDRTHTGVGDITFFGQYKFDKFINPDVVNVTAQLDVVLPTGNRTEGLDTGKFGVRPLVLAYKDFGPIGDGELGAYGVFGGTLTTDSDLRAGVAVTYEIDRIAGIVEVFDQTGDRDFSGGGKPFLTVTPGFSFRQIDPLELVVGFPLGLTENSPHWGVNVKLTYAFGK